MKRAVRKAFFASTASLSLALAISTSVFPREAGAFWYATEMTQIMNQIQLLTQKIQDAGEYVSTQKHRLDELQDMQRKLTDLNKMLNLLQMPVSFDLTERNELEGVSDRCPGTQPGFSFAGVLQRISQQSSADTIARQLQLCQMIAITENRKHNELVKMFKHASAKMTKIDRELDKTLKSSSNPGVSTAGQNSAQVMLNQSLAEMEYFDSKIKAYDALIVSMKSDQSALAKRAMKGGNNPVGTVFKTAALAAALEINETE